MPQVRFVNLGLAVDLFFNRLTLQVDQFESGAHVLTPPSRIGPLQKYYHSVILTGVTSYISSNDGLAPQLF